VRKVAEAVDYAHRKGVVHRDLKPANVLIDTEGGVKVTDFGIARRLTVPESDEPKSTVWSPRRHTAKTIFRLTVSGTVMGTPGFMAPEQAMDARRAGPAADIWALGAILYACLTGRPPFLGATGLETMTLAVETEPVPPDELNPAADPTLVEICLKCLQKNPADRYASAADLAAQIAHWQHGLPGPSPWIARRKRLARWLADTPELFPLIAGLIVHRLGNVQEGLFVGFALAGIHLSARRGPLSGVAGAAAINVLFVIAFVTMGWLPIPRMEFPAFVVSAMGLLAAAVTLGCGWANLDARNARGSPGRITGLCLAAAAVGLLATAAMFLWGDRVPDLAEFWSRRTGRVASWFLAIPLGLAVGALLGRAAQILGGRPWAVQVGAAVVAVMVLAIYREIRPDEPVDTARFTFLGPGAALAIAEGRAVHCLGPLPTVRWAAIGGIFWLKILLLAAPMIAGAAIGAIASRWGKR
jgi:hypothetical protein